MSNQTLLIPDKIKVGFDNRGDTYTKKLAYVIYYDSKGVLRKETSWQGWRDHKIKPLDLDNTPTEGFVLNKSGGGVRQSYGWNARSEFIRVYDPRDFEFEISVSNLLFILKECDCSKGKGLEGKFVYAWDRNNLVLLPAISEDYKASKKYTELQAQSISGKELIDGCAYLTKKQQVLTFIGKLDYHFVATKVLDKKQPKGVAKKYVFWDGKDFVILDNTKSIGALNSDVVSDNFAEIRIKYHNSVMGTKVKNVFLQGGPAGKEHYYNYWFYQNENGVYERCHSDTEKMTIDAEVEFKDGILTKRQVLKQAPRPGVTSRSYFYGYHDDRNLIKADWKAETDQRLHVELESGKKYRYTQLKQAI